MSEPATHNHWRIPFILVVLLGFVGMASYFGLYLGKRAAEVEERREAPLPIQQSLTHAPGDSEPVTPLFLFVKNPSDNDMDVVSDEVRLAADAGVNQIVLGVPLPWEAQDVDTLFNRIAAVIKSNSRVRIWLFVRLDPPAAWISAHQTDCYQSGDNGPSFVSMASDTWRKEVLDRLDRMIGALERSESGKRVSGLMLGCLEDGWWQYPQGQDRSETNKTGFRAWLATRYPDDASLNKAWGTEAMMRSAADIPQKATHTVKEEVFLGQPDATLWRDYLEYSTDVLTGAIVTIAGKAKELTQEKMEIVIPYGFSFEQSRNDSGHFGLQSLLESSIDAIASPVTYIDRGLGGVGGPIGPIDSAAFYGKRWYLIDDTRTGVEKDPRSGTITHVKGLRPDDVFSVHARNFSLALTHSLGMMWTDPDGMGWLHDPQLWEKLSFLRRCYAEHIRQENDAKSSRQASAEEWPGDGQTITVVVDENVRFHQHTDARINEVLVPQIRDAAMCAGMVVKFLRLQDVIQGKGAVSTAYLYANAYLLTPQERQILLDRMAREKAVAIWCYSPGYLDPSPSLEGIKACTRMDVRQCDAGSQSGSVYGLDGGAWISKGVEFGVQQSWTPLFTVDPEGLDVLATYQDSGKPSVALKFFPEGWTSVFVAEPTLTAALLREILRISGARLCIKEAPNLPMDVLSLGHGYLAIHARGSGERIVDMGIQADIEDLLDPSLVWRNKSSFVLTLKTGRTRLLKITPSESNEGDDPEEELVQPSNTQPQS